ncbi:hypothetical protein [Nannocystis sp. SCPEA4]|uniref:hypothetical protein n=1 Tax=Nannocystis sp. SCPEA4 TaxID=2996787 RepID=UPI00226E6352|nr:hypothetical protein [Nannocystis sp. SCPEA4]MCY1054656.1 hypothetical protein [Nannocystis sp. SCPEA4]
MSQISSGNPVIDTRMAELLAGGVPFHMFSLPFRLRFQFTGEVAQAARGSAIAFSGPAKLSEPFMLQTQLTVTIDGDGRHELRFGAVDVAGVLEREVRGRLAGPARATYDRLVQPYAPQLRNCTVIVASHAGDDRVLGPIGAGVNFYGEVAFAAVEPTRALCKSFPQAQLDARVLPLHVGCRNDATLTFVIEGSAALGVELGTPAVTLDRLALRVTQASASPVAAAAVPFTLRVGGETKAFAGVLADAGGKLTNIGSLDAESAAWADPLGARGLTLTNVQIRLQPTGAAPYVRVELQAGTRIGGEKVDAKPILLFDAAAPERAVLRIVSDVVTDLRRLLAGLIDPKWLPEALIGLPLDDYALAIAPNGGTIEGTTYATGIALRGAIDLWGFRASVDGALSFSGGGHLYGAMSRIAFPEEGWLIHIRGEGEAGPSLRLDFSEAKRGVHVIGAVKIVTRYNHAFELVVEREHLKIALGKTQLGIYAGGVLEVGDGKVTLTAESNFHGRCKVPLGRFSIELDADVAAAYRATGTRELVRQDVVFRLDACGAELDFAANAGTLRFEEVESLAKFFAQQSERIGQLIAQQLLLGPLAGIAWLQQYLPDPTQVAMVARDVGMACAAAADAIRQVFSLGAEACATSLRLAAFSTYKIAEAMTTAYGMTERAAGELLDKIGVPAKEIAKAMHKAFDWSAEETAEFCKDVLDLGDKATRNALEAADYSSKEIKKAMKDVFDWTEDMWNSFIDLF